MSSLRSALEEFPEDPSGLPDGRLEEDFAELTWAAERIHVKRLKLLSLIDDRGTFHRDGILSTASWLVGTFRMAWSGAKHLIRQSRALKEMPGAREALEAGGITTDALRVLVDARQSHPQKYPDFESNLVEAARRMDLPDLRKVVAYWSAAVEQQEPQGREERLHTMRRLFVSPLLDGMVRIDGDLDPETGEALITALGAIGDADIRSGDSQADVRTPAQRRADALGELCRQYLDHPDRPPLDRSVPTW